MIFLQNNKLELLEFFEKYRELFEKSVKPFIRITGNVEKTELWDSKFGGYPYLPLGFQYPQDSSGTYLRLLAQINFEQVPNVQDFPNNGILQFYISPDDISYGHNYKEKTNQDMFRIVYFDNINKNNSELTTNFDFLNYSNSSMLPFKNECKLIFHLDTKPVSATDISFEKIFGKNAIFN